MFKRLLGIFIAVFALAIPPGIGQASRSEGCPQGALAPIWKRQFGERGCKLLVGPKALYLLETDETQEQLSAMDAAGNILWSVAVGPAGETISLSAVHNGVVVASLERIACISDCAALRWTLNQSEFTPDTQAGAAEHIVDRERWTDGLVCLEDVIGLDAHGRIAWIRTFTAKTMLPRRHLNPGVDFFFASVTDAEGKNIVQRFSLDGTTPGAASTIQAIVERVTPLAEAGYVLDCSNGHWCGNGQSSWVSLIDEDGKVRWTSAGEQHVRFCCELPGGRLLLRAVSYDEEPGHDELRCLDRDGQLLWRQPYAGIREPLATGNGTAFYLGYPDGVPGIGFIELDPAGEVLQARPLDLALAKETYTPLQTFRLRDGLIIVEAGASLYAYDINRPAT